MRIGTMFSTRGHRVSAMVVAGSAALSAACASGGGAPPPAGVEAEEIFAGLTGAWDVDTTTGTQSPVRKFRFEPTGPGELFKRDRPGRGHAACAPHGRGGPSENDGVVRTRPRGVAGSSEDAHPEGGRGQAALRASARTDSGNADEWRMGPVRLAAAIRSRAGVLGRRQACYRTPGGFARTGTVGTGNSGRPAANEQHTTAPAHVRSHASVRPDVRSGRRGEGSHGSPLTVRSGCIKTVFALSMNTLDAPPSSCRRAAQRARWHPTPDP